MGMGMDEPQRVLTRQEFIDRLIAFRLTPQEAEASARLVEKTIGIFADAPEGDR